MIGAAACIINGFEADCDHRLPPDVDWIELRVTELSAHEARKCAAAFARLPSGNEPRIPPSWTFAGFIPYHGFPTTVSLSSAGPAPLAADDLPNYVEPPTSSSEDYFSSSHSGSPDCARASPFFRSRHLSGHRRMQPPNPDVGPLIQDSGLSGAADASHDGSLVWQDPAPPARPRRWGRRNLALDFEASVQIPLEDEAEVTIFDPVLHARVIICSPTAIDAGLVELALARSPHLPGGYTGRVLRHRLDGFPAPQVVLFEAARTDLRAAPVAIRGDFHTVCTLSFPIEALRNGSSSCRSLSDAIHSALSSGQKGSQGGRQWA